MAQPTVHRPVANALGVALTWPDAPGSGGGPAADAAADIQVPPNGFVVRQDSFDELAILLARGRLVTVSGPPGAGKSRLVAEYLIRNGVDVAGYVDLGEAAADADVSAAIVAAALAAGRGALLVLDGCDHVMRACVRTVPALLRADPSLTILATSREAFRIAGEALLPVGCLPRDEATALLALRLAERNSAFHDADPALLGRVCRALDGLPLAIELAAAACDVMSPADLLRRLDGSLDVLAGGDRGSHPRQQTLTAAFDWSFDLLDDAEHALLARLAVFAGSFRLAEAERVCAGVDPAGGGPGLSEPAAHPVLGGIAALAAKSLLVREARGDEIRYRLLSTIATALRTRARARPQLEECRRAHARWCLELAEAAPAEGAAGFAQRLERVAEHTADMTAALGWCRDADAATGLRLARALVPSWQASGDGAAGCRWLAGLLPDGGPPPGAAGEAVTPAAGWGLLDLGALHCGRGEFAAARAAAERAASIFAAAPQASGSASARLLLATIAVAAGTMHAGKLLQDVAAQQAAVTDWPAGVIEALLSCAVADTGEPAAARAACVALIRSAAVTETPLVLVAAEITFGQLAAERGELATARQVLEHAAELARELGFTRAVAQAAQRLGAIAAITGEQAAAAVLLREAVSLAAAAGSPAALAGARNELAGLLRAADPQAACALHRQVLAEAAAIGPRETAMALLGICRADAGTAGGSVTSGDAVTAGGMGAAGGMGRVLATEAEVLAKRTGDTVLTARALHAQGLAAAAAGDEAGAWSALRAALAIRAEAGLLPEVTASLTALAAQAARHGRPRLAGTLARAARELAEGMGLFAPLGLHACGVHAAVMPEAAEFERGWAAAAGRPLADVLAEVLSQRGGRAAVTGWAALTRAEAEVARLAAEGLTNREIAQRLFVSHRTVQTHLSHVFSKLELGSRRELIGAMRARAQHLGGAAEGTLRRALGLPAAAGSDDADDLAALVTVGVWRQPAGSWHRA